MAKPRAFRIAIDAVLNFIVTFGPFWFLGGTKSTRPIDAATLVGIILIWMIAATIAAVLSDRLISKLFHRQQK